MAWFPSVRPLTFSRLRDKIHFFYPILLKLRQIVCIVVSINPVENEENPSNMGKGVISNFDYFFSYTQLIPQFFVHVLKLAQISFIIIDINPIEKEENPSNIMGRGTISNFGYFLFSFSNKVHTFLFNSSFF